LILVSSDGDEHFSIVAGFVVCLVVVVSPVVALRRAVDLRPLLLDGVGSCDRSRVVVVAAECLVPGRHVKLWCRGRSVGVAG